MNIEGTYTLQATPEDIWNCLLDKEILLRTVPGLTRLEPVGDDSYAISLHLKYAPLMGVYNGHVTITEQQQPYYCHITITGEERQNTIGGHGSLHINERNGLTIINYKGTITIGKPGALLSPLVVTGIAKLFVQHFLNALAAHLRTVYHGNTEEVGRPDHRYPAGAVAVLPGTSTGQKTTLSALSLKLTHLLGIGHGDPEQEIRWAQRLRRGSIIAGLLFLVWVGTRLPRRR